MKMGCCNDDACNELMKRTTSTERAICFAIAWKSRRPINREKSTAMSIAKGHALIYSFKLFAPKLVWAELVVDDHQYLSAIKVSCGLQYPISITSLIIIWSLSLHRL